MNIGIRKRQIARADMDSRTANVYSEEFINQYGRTTTIYAAKHKDDILKAELCKCKNIHSSAECSCVADYPPTSIRSILKEASSVNLIKVR